MAKIVLLGYASETERPLRRAFTARGHSFVLIEPDFPAAKRNVELADPAAFLLDPTVKASHVREAAAYFAGLKRFARAPFFILSDDPEAAARIRPAVPRAEPVARAAALARVEAALAGRTA